MKLDKGVKEGPFPEGVLEQAREAVRHYRLTIEESQQGGFLGSSIEMPHVFAHAAEVEACLAKTRSALAIAVAALIESGRAVPAPTSENRRDQQVNIRMSANEKALLEQASNREGFRSLSDFLRTTTLRIALAG